MKILYAVQSTGNGHIIRANELIKILKKRAEVDVLIETNPYVLRTLVNSDMLVILNLKMLSLLQKIGEEKMSDEQKKEMKEINDELLEFTKNRKFRSEKDLEFFKNIDKKWFD